MTDRLLSIDEENALHSKWEQLNPDIRISWRDYWLKAQADLTKAETLKKIGKQLADSLEDSFVMAYAGEDIPYESTIDPQTIREMIAQLKAGTIPEGGLDGNNIL